jgi:hypothetical protein
MNGTRYAAPDWRQWFLDVASWDGLFPAFIFLTSYLAARLFPNNQGLAEILMVCLPIIGVLTRFMIGSKKIKSNYCGLWVRRMQFVTLGVAVLMFMAFDFFIVLGAFIRRQNQNFLAPADYWVLGIIAVIYLSLVTFAMYPGREPMYTNDSDFQFGEFGNSPPRL